MLYCRFQVHQIERRNWKKSSYFWARLELWRKIFCASVFYEKGNWSWRLKTKGCFRLPKAQEEGILALSLACLLEIDGEHLGWCSFYRPGARLLVATVAPPSGGGGLCLKDTTESETGILQAPTLPPPVNNTKDFNTATTKRIIERRRIVLQKRRRSNAGVHCMIFLAI